MLLKEAKKFFKGHGIKIKKKCTVSLNKFLKAGNSEEEVKIDLSKITCEIKGVNCDKELETYLSGKNIDCSDNSEDSAA